MGQESSAVEESAGPESGGEAEPEDGGPEPESEPWDEAEPESEPERPDPEAASDDRGLEPAARGGPDWHAYRRVRAYAVGGTFGLLGPVAFVGVEYFVAERTPGYCAVGCLTPEASFAHRVIAHVPAGIGFGIVAVIGYCFVVERLYRYRLAADQCGPRAVKPGDSTPPSKLAWLAFFVAAFGLAAVLGVLRGLIMSWSGR